MTYNNIPFLFDKSLFAHTLLSERNERAFIRGSPPFRGGYCQLVSKEPTMNDDNLHELLKTAAELRADGLTWDEVASQLHRAVATCKAWPSRYQSSWQSLYRNAQVARCQYLADKSLKVLERLQDDLDVRVQKHASDLLLRHSRLMLGVGVKGGARPPEKNDAIVDSYRKLMDWERDRIDRLRAERGLPPATDTEFQQELDREHEEWLNHQ